MSLALLHACGDDRADDSSGGRDASQDVIDDPSDVRRFCGLIMEWATANQTLEDPESTGAQLNAMDRVLELFREVPAAAPESIRDDMRVIASTPPDAVRVSDADSRAAAEDVVDAYITSECDARFSFEGYDFTG